MIFAWFWSLTERVILVSGSSLVMSNKVFIGSAAIPASSRLDGISVTMVISKSVAFKIVLSCLESIKTQPSIGRVDLVGKLLITFEVLLAVRFSM